MGKLARNVLMDALNAPMIVQRFVWDVLIVSDPTKQENAPNALKIVRDVMTMETAWSMMESQSSTTKRSSARRTVNPVGPIYHAVKSKKVPS